MQKELEQQALGLRFREVMAHVSTPVAVVTATDSEGRPYGTTVSAFASLSMSPPMVLVSLDRTSRILQVIHETGHFAVNVLASDQEAMARAFASKSDDKFAGVDWVIDGGLPRIVGSAGWLRCTTVQAVEGGDHLIVLGSIDDVEHVLRPPLTYHARTFGTHVAPASRTEG